MASMSSMISLIVMLLATYAYSVPIMSDFQNATSTMEVENATVDFRLENVVLFVRANETVGLSSSSSEDDSDRVHQTTDKPSRRNFEDSSFPSATETNVEHDVTTADNEHTFTEESLSTEVNTKRGIEVETFETSTDDQTSVAPSSEVKIAKRSSGSESWLAEGGSWPSIQSDDNGDRRKRASGSESWLAEGGSWPSIQSDDTGDRRKRASGSESWLAEGGSWPSIQSDDNGDRRKRSSDVQISTDESETSTVEETSVPSTSEMIHSEHNMEESSSFPTEEKEHFNRRAFPQMRSSGRMMMRPTQGMQRPSSSLNGQMNKFNRRAMESVQVEELSTIIAATVESEATTEEPQSSTDIIRDDVSSSTSDYETTEAPVEDFTSSSPVPSASTAKILAIIPGKISRGQLLVNPATGKTAGFRPAQQVQLTQGQNQTLFEERKPNY